MKIEGIKSIGNTPNEEKNKRYEDLPKKKKKMPIVEVFGIEKTRKEEKKDETKGRKFDETV